MTARRALLSVSDKTGLIDFAKRLAAQDIALISTGGTARQLREAGLDVEDVSAVTGLPEMMDGRVKTLHPKVHGGLLARRDLDSHRAALSDHQIPEIDLLIVNLYPFAETVARGAAADEVIENIDIGGPAMIRSAAKNHAFVSVVVDPEDYEAVAKALEEGGTLPDNQRRDLAAKAFAHTAAYDGMIAAWFADRQGTACPPTRVLAGTLAETLRYGENPHQWAGFYKTGAARPGIATARQIQGKALSFNNLNDTNAAFELVAEFDPAEAAAVAIIKHANPCGVARAGTLAEAYRMAHRCDPVSAFGGIVATNRPLDAEIASLITEIFTEVVIAPDASAEALKTLSKKSGLRVLLTGDLPDPAAPGLDLRTVAGGFLAQARDSGRVTTAGLKIVTQHQPSEQELRDMLFAFMIAKHVKSNAIVYAKEEATVGIGAGQMSRVDAARIAARKADDAAEAAGLNTTLTKDSVVASDAFFPFADGLLIAVEAGATAVIQPGGSIRDAEVIAAADEAGLAMAFTGMRHFRH